MPNAKPKDMHSPRDAAEFDEASYEIDFAGICDGAPDATLPARLFPGTPAPTYRQASLALLRTLNQSLTFFSEHGYSRSKTLWGVAFALGHPLTAGMSMLEAARHLGCTKAAISKIACEFLAETGLPPSPALKIEKAKSTYRKTNGNRKHGNSKQHN
jgi:hypothetical protein